MSRLRVTKKRSRGEPTIALINIVFLMLIFFLLAGTLAKPVAGDISLIETANIEGSPPPDTLVVHPDGRLVYEGEDVSLDRFVTAQQDKENIVWRMLPDRDLPAQELVRISGELQAAGAESVVLVTERSGE
ncbi:ExbD/TolR family protein [Paracoccaceae bacterium GXU_MW_L88]